MRPEVFTPVVTILTDDDKFDIAGNLRVMESLIEHGVDGIVPLGSTGEFTWFCKQDKQEYLEEYIKAVDNRVKLLVGVSGLDYRDTIELANFVSAQKVKGVLICSEFYFNMSPTDFYRYYSFMAEHIEGNIFIYNYPARTGSCIPADTVAALASRYANIAGLKDSVPEFSHTKEVLEKVLEVRPDFEVFSGFDNHFLYNHRAGGAGNIGALSNIVPELWREWADAIADQDEEGMDKGQARMDALMEIYSLESNPQKLMKELLKHRGMEISTHCHFPFDYLEEGSLETALDILHKVAVHASM